MDYDTFKLLEQVEEVGKQTNENTYCQLCNALRDLHASKQYPWAYRVAYKTSILSLRYDANQLKTRFMVWTDTGTPELMTHREAQKYIVDSEDQVLIIPIRVPKREADVPSFLEEARDIKDI